MEAEDFYNKTAGFYNERHDVAPTTQWFKKHENRAVLKYAKGRTLDIGCGTGDTLKLLKDYVGLDVSSGMLSIAKKRGFKNLVLGDAEKLPFPAESFDSVLCLFAVLNMCSLDRAASEMARVLKTGGVAVISLASVYDNCYRFPEKLRLKNPHKRKKFHVKKARMVINLCTKEEVEKAFSQHGFRPVHFDGFFVFQDPKWGNYNMLSLAEKTRLGLERALPLKKYGCMYLFVFRRER